MCSNCGWDQDYELPEDQTDLDGLPPAFEDLAEQESFIDDLHRQEFEENLGEHQTDISDEGYCTNCGKEQPSIKMIDGEQLCSDCRHERDNIVSPE